MLCPSHAKLPFWATPLLHLSQCGYRCGVEWTGEEWRKEKETKRDWRVEVMMAECSKKAEAGGEWKESESRLGERKEIEELRKMEPLWQRWCVDGGWTGSLSCGSEMGPDRAISHVEIYPGSFFFFQWWKDESERPFPLVMNIYLVRAFTGCCMEWQIVLSKETTYIFDSHLLRHPFPPATVSHLIYGLCSPGCLICLEHLDRDYLLKQKAVVNAYFRTKTSLSIISRHFFTHKHAGMVWWIRSVSNKCSHCCFCIKHRQSSFSER